MNTYYFEIPDRLVGKEYDHKYYYATGELNDGSRFNLIYDSVRIWFEGHDGVSYRKNKRSVYPNDSTVNLKEFMWIKLQSHEVD